MTEKKLKLILYYGLSFSQRMLFSLHHLAPNFFFFKIMDYNLKVREEGKSLE